ncbi:MAG: D-glycero-beta-D-manno-heptose 1-phosphate adenylyltransferase [Schwartzia sp.]|nr:D-glycero-beta-D-manno-heptose 1-phosphate adenylyltransferase [Schwartzia sp. (in: firmicutes)]MBP3690283.1 D-glycero-beta-D-manno-heptose 1-phosphate adenylyltransferase [Schwartzia sp. (in: firmicutes)]
MIIPREYIKEACDTVRADGGTIVFTNGCFDILHAGHVRYLTAAEAMGDFLVIGLNSDASVRRLKGEGRPIVSEADRAEVLDALRAVDIVTIFDEPTAEELVRLVRPNVYVKGGDYSLDTLPEAKIVQAAGGRVEFIPFLEGHSTTGVIERIKASGE